VLFVSGLLERKELKEQMFEKSLNEKD